MVPLIDKPAYIILLMKRLSSITDFCFIINEDERSTIEHYFSADYALDAILAERRKEYLIKPVMSSLRKALFPTLLNQNLLAWGTRC